MAKEDFVVIHGSVKTPEGVVEYGQSVALEPAEAKKMDPTGVSLKPKAIWDAEQKGIKAGAEAKAAALAESAKPAAHKEKSK